ncbi:MAG: hypothetical protein JXA08_03905 [Methanomicrobiaceae archaeon]|nr:hypothetical protein [Methanomicrobiaceae archaeon]
MPEVTEKSPCTVKDGKICNDCTLGPDLHCRWDKNVLNGFLAIAFPTIIGTPILFLLLYLLTDRWWPVAVYLVYTVMIFLFEFRFLCSHYPTMQAKECS